MEGGSAEVKNEERLGQEERRGDETRQLPLDILVCY